MIRLYLTDLTQNLKMNKNIYVQQGLVNQADRQLQAGHRSVVLWFTGLSGAGKSTLAHAVEKPCLIAAAEHLCLMAITSVMVCVRI